MALVHVSGRAPAKSAGTVSGGRRFSRWLLVGVAVLVAAAPVGSGGIAAAAPAHLPPGAGRPDFGPNVKIFDPTTPTSEIQATVDAIASQQVDDEMGTQRYALLFKPGTYGTPEHPLIFQVGYYTEVAGLGVSPTDVIINGSQQQFLVRDSSIGGWSNAVWNQVFAGVQGAPAQSFPNPPYTTLPTTPVSRERPYL